MSRPTAPPHGEQFHRDGDTVQQRRILTAALGLIVVLVVGCVHHPSLNDTAIWLDDPQYVTENPLVLNPSWHSVTRFFSEVRSPSTVVGYYQPLTMASLMIDSAAGGGVDRLGPFHRTNLLLHLINTCLILVFLTMLFGEPRTAALVALLFGVHPITVEPVSWITERKTLLSAVFTLGSLIAYVRYAGLRQHPSSGRASIAASYAATLGFYVLALMSKPTSTPLPILLILLDYWPLNRLNRTAFLEKVPLILTGVIASAIAIVSQDSTGIIQYPADQGASTVVLSLFHNFLFYPATLLWPTQLSPYYVRPDPMSLSNPSLLAAVLVTLILTCGLLLSLRWTRAFVVGWMFYLAALLPTMGILRVAPTIAADKYAYLPSIGLLLPIGWLLATWWTGSARSPHKTSLRCALLAGCLILAGAEGFATRNYLPVWNDRDSLYGYVFSHSPKAYWLRVTLADQLAKEGKFFDALPHYLKAAAAEEAAGVPHRPTVQQNIGNALVLLDRTGEAIPYYRRALTLDPASVETKINLGMALRRIGQTTEAVALFTEVLSADSRNPEVNYQLGLALAKEGKTAQALDHYRAAVLSKGDFLDAHLEFADELLDADRLAEAVTEYRAALRLDPDNSRAHNNLGAALMSEGRLDEAIEHFRAVLRENPNDHDALANLHEALSRRGEHHAD
jgi:tetratricopeptide (TPR) repeat protein